MHQTPLSGTRADDRFAQLSAQALSVDSMKLRGKSTEIMDSARFDHGCDRCLRHVPMCRYAKDSLRPGKRRAKSGLKIVAERVHGVAVPHK